MSDSLDHLSLCIAGKDTENDRSLIGESQIHDATGCLSTYVVKMWSISSDDDSYRDDEIIALCFKEFCGKSWDFECSRNPVGIDILKSIPLEKFSIGLFECFSMNLVKLADHERNSNIVSDLTGIFEGCFVV